MLPHSDNEGLGWNTILKVMCIQVILSSHISYIKNNTVEEE